jgi:hypothetical protein
MIGTIYGTENMKKFQALVKWGKGSKGDNLRHLGRCWKTVVTWTNYKLYGSMRSFYSHVYIYIYHIVDNYMLWYHIYIYIHSIKFTYNYIICILYDVLQTIIYRLYIYNYIHSIYCKYTSCLSNSSVKNMQPSGSPNWFPETIFKGPTWINTTEFTH